MTSFKATSRTFTLGASVTLTDLMELFTKEAAKAGNTGGFNELKKYLYRVASYPIRNVGGDNLIINQTIVGIKVFLDLYVQGVKE